jgi:predicted DNA-binding transcriptional regulator YafY
MVKAQEIADKFSIGLRTVYRDIKALNEAGVPVTGEAGIGYRLMEGYRLPPVMFTEDEATVLLTAGKLMQSMSDETSSKHYTTALDKIRAVLRLAEKNHLDEIENHIEVISHPSLAHKKPPELHLVQILKAIGLSSVIEIHYTSVGRKESTRRNVEPIGIYFMGSHWYLIAYCRLRGDYRNFRTDNIKKIALTFDKFEQTHPPLHSFIGKITEERGVHKVVIEAKADSFKYLGDQKYYNGFVSEEVIGNVIQMTFLSCSLAGFAHWFMLFGEHAKIIEPLALNDTVAEIAQNILKKVRQQQMIPSL